MSQRSTARPHPAVQPERSTRLTARIRTGDHFQPELRSRRRRQTLPIPRARAKQQRLGQSSRRITASTKTTPTITFNQAPTATFGGGNFSVSATTSNTDSSALTYSVVSGPCAFVSVDSQLKRRRRFDVTRGAAAETANYQVERLARTQYPLTIPRQVRRRW